MENVAKRVLEKFDEKDFHVIDLKVVKPDEKDLERVEFWEMVNANQQGINEAMNVPVGAGDTKVGIWWYSIKNKELIKYTEPLVSVAKDSVGFFDVPVSHYNYWENMKKYIPAEYRELEYDELPRGRVILWETDAGEYVIKLFGHKKLLENKPFLRLLLKEFDIKFPNDPFKITRVMDDHYRLNKNL